MLNWFRVRKLESDLDRELKYHVDRRVSDLIHSGLPESEARRQAASELGGAGATKIREQVRDIWLSRWPRDFLYDCRFSVRSLLRSPSFTVTAVLSLALGIGATTAIYSLVDQVILRALPVDHPERLVLFNWNGNQLADTFGTTDLMSYPICRDLQEQKQFFDGVFCRAATTVNLSTGGDQKPTAAELVSGTYFSILGVNPALGRLLTIEDDQIPGASPVVVLSSDFWKNQMGSAPDIVGRKVLVNRYAMTVVGVAAPTFHGVDVGELPSLWIPATMATQAIPGTGFNFLSNRRTRWMQILGRLRPDVSLAQARAGLQPWFKAVLKDDTRRADFPKVRPEKMQQFLASTLELNPAPQGHSVLRRNLSRPLWILFAATAVLLALACLNIAGLLLARGSVRQREVRTRLALGASQGRIARQLLAESALLALAGGFLGVVMALLAVRALLEFLPQDVGANGLQATVDERLLLFAFFISMVTGLLSGCAPAFEAGRKSPVSVLWEHAGTAFGGLRLRRAILTAQIAFTLILVISAGLFVRSLSGLLAKGPGFDTSSLISFDIDAARNGYSPSDANLLLGRIFEEMQRSPSTRSSAIAAFPLLIGGAWNNPLTIQSNNNRFATGQDVHLNAVSPGFFATLGTRIVTGRVFDEHDSLPASEGGRPVVIVNQAFVKRYFGGNNPLGAHVCMGSRPDAKPDTEIIGVVENFSYRSVREQWEQAYFPMHTDHFGSTFYVRVRGTPESASGVIRAILGSIDPTLPITHFSTLDEQVSECLLCSKLEWL